MSGVLQSSILRPVVFNVLINYLDTGLEAILSVFVDDIRYGVPVDSLVGIEVLRRDLDKLVGWVITHHIKLKKNKCWILHLG